MARIVLGTAVAVVLAAAAVAMPTMVPNKAYCTGTTAMIFNGAYMLMTDTSDSSDCKRLFTYSVENGNVTLVENFRQNCYSDETRVAWLSYDNSTDSLLSRFNDDDSNAFQTSLTPCTTAAADYLAAGNYCGAATSLVAANDYGLIVAEWNGQRCVQGGKMVTSSSSTSSLFPNYLAGNCSSTFNIDAQWVNKADNTLSVRFDVDDRLVTLSQTNCITTEDQTPNDGSNYCVANDASSAFYQNSMFSALNATHYAMVFRRGSTSSSYSYYGRTCTRQGRYWTKGTTVSMTIDTDTCNSYTSSIAPKLLTANFHSNQTWVFQDNANNWFTASRCVATQPTVPSGQYCASENARLFVGEDSFALWSDSNHFRAGFQVYGRILRNDAGAYLDKINAPSCSSMSSDDIVISNASGVIYVNAICGSTVSALAFSASFCGTAAVKPPNGEYCFNAGGADSKMVMRNGTFVMTLNNSWVNSRYSRTSPCVSAGFANARNGQVSFHVDASNCDSNYSPPSRYWLRNMMYTTVNSVTTITYTLQNSSTNTSVTSETCPTTTSSLLGTSGATFCPVSSSAMPTVPSSMAVWGDYLLVADYSMGTPCVGIGMATGKTGSKVWMSWKAMSCNYSPKMIEILSNGDLYANYSGNNALVWSSSACVSPFTAPAAPVGGFCGMMSTPSATSAPTPSAPPASSAAPTPTTNVSSAKVKGVAMLGATAADFAKVSLGVTATGSFTLVVEPVSGATACYMRGTMTGAATSAGFMTISTDGCSDWTLVQVLKGATADALTVSLQYQTDAPSAVSVSATTCATWFPSVSSGAYCPPAPWATQQVNNVTVFGQYLMFTSQQWGSGPNVLVNMSAVATGATNVTAQQTTYSWYTSDSRYTGYDSDFWINTIGTRGLSFSTRSGTYAVSLDGCTPNATLTSPMAVASAELADLGGKVFAALDGAGGFAMTFPGKIGLDRRCYVSGSILETGAALTLTTSSSMRNTNNCGDYFMLSRGMKNADGSISVDVNYMNKSVTVSLASSGCAAVTMNIPTGTYCPMPGTRRYFCNGEYFQMSAGAVQAFGNFTQQNTANGNNSVSVWSGSPNMPFSFSSSVIPTETTLAWNASAATLTQNVFRADSLRMMSASLCNDMQMDAALDGPYCGVSADGGNATFIALGGNQFTLQFQNTVSSVKYQCRFVGQYRWVAATGLVDFAALDMPNSNGCYFDGSWDAAPRVRFTSIAYNNQSFGFAFTANVWSAATATPTSFTFRLNANQCSTRVKALTLANSIPMPEGMYAVKGAGVDAKVFQLGDSYAISLVYNASLFPSLPASSGMGTNTFPMRSLTSSLVAPVLTYTYSSMPAEYGMSSVINATLKDKSLLRMLLTASPGSSSSQMALPLVFTGNAPSTKAAAAYDAAEAEKKATKVAIIIGIAIAVVLVVVIVALIVVKSRGGSSQPPTEAGGQDYRPMNGV